MRRDEVLRILANNRKALAARGIKAMRLFGSVARDKASRSSDVDLLVEFDHSVGLFDLIRLQQDLEKLFDCGVDLGTPDSIKPRIRQRVLEECIDVTSILAGTD